MSADVAPTFLFEGDNVEDTAKRRRSGILNVWNEPSLHLVTNQSDYIQEEIEEPHSSSVDDCADLEYERERQHVAFLAAVELLNGVASEENLRKSSDSIIHHRVCSEMKRRNVTVKKRCLSDSNATRIDLASFASFENGNALPRFDSGIAEARPLELSSLDQTPLTLSDGESSPPVVKTTGHISTTKSSIIKRSGSLDDRVMRQLNIEDDSSSHHSAASSGSKNKRGAITKHLSQCSMGGSSTSFSSFYECTSNASIATDILSGLGFGDFDNPELIPDRFIPNEIEYAKPSLMKENSVLASCTPDVYSNSPLQPPPPPPLPPLPPDSTTVPSNSADCDLPLGATADNFLFSKTNRSQSPPPSSPPTFIPNPLPPHRFVDPSLDRKYSVYALINPGLETVPEETASELSTSPRWLSPRVSLDHSGLDLSMPHLGASLAAANRKRSLPNRDGYRVSVDSMISEQDSTVYFSITSYDDDIAKEIEEAVPPPLPLEDITVPRRRRKGVHGAPPELLSWLQTNPILEECGSNEEPWPFNEQIRLRRSLTEIEQRRSRTSSSDTIGDRSLSPLPFHDPLAGLFPRRFSINGPLKPQMYPSELRRMSLPSNSSFRQYNPPVPEEEELEISTLTRKSSDVTHRTSNKLPPGMTRNEALEYKREATVLRSHVEEVEKKLHSSERVMKTMEEDHRRKFSDTQEWLRSELWMKERHCRELEEIVESQKQNLAQLQQNYQIKLARAREETRDIKDREIKELHHKMKQKEQEHEEKVGRLEDECKHLRFKETQLLKKITQQGLKNENEDLHREVIRLKEQFRKEKETVASIVKEKGTEIKSLRNKYQLDKEEALKQLKHHLQKLHDAEINSMKQQLLKGSFSEPSPSKPAISSGQTPSKVELKKLRYQIERQDLDLRSMADEINELQCQLKILHKEHLGLEKKVAKEIHQQ